MEKAIETFWKMIDIALALITILMIGLVFTNVVLRYGFESGMRESVELSRLGLVWVVMLGAAVVLRKGDHLAVTEFSHKFLPRAIPVLHKLIWAIIFVCVCMLVLGSFKQMQANWHNISQLTGLPSALFYLPGVISGVLMAVIAVARFFGPPDANPDDKDREIQL